MSFLLGLLKNPRVIAWGLAIAIMAGLFTYGKIQHIHEDRLR